MDDSKLKIGQYGYINEWKQSKIKQSITYFVFAAVLVILPGVIMHVKYNAFTIAGIVMLLPGVKDLFQYLSFKNIKSGDEKSYEKIHELVKDKPWISLLSDLILKNETGNMILDMAIVFNGNIYGYAPKQPKKSETIENYLNNLLSESGSEKKAVVHDEFEEFYDMVMMLAANKPSNMVDSCRIEAELRSLCI